MPQKRLHTFWKYSKHLSLLGVLICVISALFVSIQSKNTIESSSEFHSMFVLDVSSSMNTRDGSNTGDSRLWVSKKTIQDIVLNLSDEFGLTVFSGTSERVVPHTSDRGVFLTFLQGVDRKNVWEWGTNITRALKEAILDFDQESSWNIIVFSDGWAQDRDDIQELKQVLRDKNIELYIVGVGTKKWWYIPMGTDAFGVTFYKTYKWKRVVSKLDEKELKSIARELWATYIPLDKIHNLDIFERDQTDDGDDTWEREMPWILAFIWALFWMYFLGTIFFDKYWVWKK